MLHTAFLVEDMRAGETDDMGIGLDVHKADHASSLETFLHVLAEVLIFGVVQKHQLIGTQAVFVVE
jgi:hypothetical protein